MRFLVVLALTFLLPSLAVAQTWPADADWEREEKLTFVANPELNDERRKTIELSEQDKAIAVALRDVDFTTLDEYRELDDDIEPNEFIFYRIDRDAGPLIMLAAGGIHTEIYRDRAAADHVDRTLGEAGGGQGKARLRLGGGALVVQHHADVRPGPEVGRGAGEAGARPFARPSRRRS